jgi:hypothetical protein
MKPKKYTSPANEESWYRACTSQPPGWPEQTDRATNGWQVNWLDPDRLERAG